MTARHPLTTINLGGEGEVPGVVNQQRAAALSSSWASCVRGEPVERLARAGHDFLICDNTRLPLADASVSLVLTNSVPIDIVVLGEPGVQSSEIRRILAPGGQWIHDGTLRYTRP
ncbi:MAG: class I SAM-dependent methyltransferase [Gemmataceae bacterium]